jgi:hypothetical protein
MKDESISHKFTEDKSLTVKNLVKYMKIKTMNSQKANGLSLNVDEVTEESNESVL